MTSTATLAPAATEVTSGLMVRLVLPGITVKAAADAAMEGL